MGDLSSVYEYPLFWNFMALLGILAALRKRHWTLLAWLLGAYFTPRESAWLTAMPLSLVAGLGLKAGWNYLRLITKDYRSQPAARVLIPFVLVSWGIFHVFLNMSWGYFSLLHNHELETGTWSQTKPAISWIKNNTPDDARFILPEDTPIFVREWFPYLSERTTLDVAYGAEWQPQEARVIQDFNSAQAHCEDLECVMEAQEKSFGYDHVYVFVLSPGDSIYKSGNALAMNSELLRISEVYRQSGATVLLLERP